MAKPIVVTTSGTVPSSTVSLNFYGLPQVSLQVNVSGSSTWTIYQTLDDPFSGTPVWFSHPDTNLVTQTVSRQGNYAYMPRALYVSGASGSTGVLTMTVIQAGLADN